MVPFSSVPGFATPGITTPGDPGGLTAFAQPPSPDPTGAPAMTPPGQAAFGGLPVEIHTGAEMFAEVVDNGQLTALGLNGTGPAPAIAGVTHCVASAPVGHDMGGSFVLTTDATSAGAGTIATITFGTALGAAPVAVLISVVDTTSTVTNVTTVVATTSSTVITVKNTAAMTASHTFLVTYVVIAS